MEFTPSVSEWLPWLGRVRFLIITFLLAVDRCHPAAGPPLRSRWRKVFILIALWYMLATIFVLAQRWLPQFPLARPVQIVLDLGDDHRHGVRHRRAG